jgi:hypothetical protein
VSGLAGYELINRGEPLLDNGSKLLSPNRYWPVKSSNFPAMFSFGPYSKISVKNNGTELFKYLKNSEKRWKRVTRQRVKI